MIVNVWCFHFAFLPSFSPSLAFFFAFPVGRRISTGISHKKTRFEIFSVYKCRNIRRSISQSAWYRRRWWTLEFREHRVVGLILYLSMALLRPEFVGTWDIAACTIYCPSIVRHPYLFGMQRQEWINLYFLCCVHSQFELLRDERWAVTTWQQFTGVPLRPSVRESHLIVNEKCNKREITFTIRSFVFGSFYLLVFQCDVPCAFLIRWQKVCWMKILFLILVFVFVFVFVLFFCFHISFVLRPRYLRDDLDSLISQHTFIQIDGVENLFA